MHMTILYGLESEDVGVALNIPEGKNNDPEFDRLFERSFGPEVATGKRRVWATFVGTIEWRQKESPNLILALKQISDITIEEPASEANTYPALASAEFLGVKFKSGHPPIGESFLNAAKPPGINQEDRLKIDADGLKTIPGARVEILGFTDGRECSGQECYELSLRRAKIVYDWFISHGVPKESLKEPEGHGSEMAIYGNETEEGRQQNRRTEVNMISP